jgi:hypothetical protein
MTTPSTEAVFDFITDLQPDAHDALAAKQLRAQTTAGADQLENLPRSQCNVGRAEQKFRLAAGAALLAGAAFFPLKNGWRIGLGVAGVFQLITGSIRYCPVSHALGINTCSTAEG